MFAALLPRPDARARRSARRASSPSIWPRSWPDRSGPFCSRPRSAHLRRLGRVFGVLGGDLRDRARSRRRRRSPRRSAFSFSSTSRSPSASAASASAATSAVSSAGAICALVIVAGERGMLGQRHFPAEMLAMAAVGVLAIARRPRRRLTAGLATQRVRDGRSSAKPMLPGGLDPLGVEQVARAARRRRSGAAPGGRRSTPRRPRTPAWRRAVRSGPVFQRLGAGAVDVPAAGHRDHHVGVEAGKLAPARPRGTSGRAGRRRPRRPRSRSSPGPSGRRRRAGRATPARSPAAGAPPRRRRGRSPACPPARRAARGPDGGIPVASPRWTTSSSISASVLGSCWITRGLPGRRAATSTTSSKETAQTAQTAWVTIRSGATSASSSSSSSYSASPSATLVFTARSISAASRFGPQHRSRQVGE